MKTKEMALGVKLKLLKVMVMKIRLPLYATERITQFKMKRGRQILLQKSTLIKCELLGRKLQSTIILFFFLIHYVIGIYQSLNTMLL